MAVLVKFQHFIGSSSAILQAIQASFNYVVYFITTDHIKKDSCQNIKNCGFQSRIMAQIAPHEGLRLPPKWLPQLQISSQTHICIYGVTQDTKRNSLVPHMTHQGPLVGVPIFGSHIWAGRGSEPVWRRGPKTSPRVSPMYRGTSQVPCRKLRLPLKFGCLPP